MLNYDEQTRQITAEQVSLIVMPNLVILFQEQAGDIFDPNRRLRHKSHPQSSRLKPHLN
jgi:hypothetical protein